MVRDGKGLVSRWASSRTPRAAQLPPAPALLLHPGCAPDPGCAPNPGSLHQAVSPTQAASSTLVSSASQPFSDHQTGAAQWDCPVMVLGGALPASPEDIAFCFSL